MKLSTQLPLDQLRPPANDVREHRPERAVQSLASSMGDPTVGQLQPVLAYPAGHEDLDLETDEDIQELVRDGHDFLVADGETRRQAARDVLGWHSIWAWVWDAPPENLTIAQLDANTERIDMSQFETIRAIVDHKRETGRTWQEIGDDIGYAPGTLSQYANVLEGPDWLTEPMRDPQHPLEVGHARDVLAGVGQEFQEAIQDVSDRSPEEARQLAHKMGRNLVDWTAEYGWSVSELREAIDRKQHDVLDDLQGPSGHRETQRQAEKDAAAQQAGAAVNAEPEPDPCIICGAEATTRLAVDVCDEDRGLLNQQRAAGEPLMAEADDQPTEPTADVEALAQALGMDPEEVAERLAQQST